MFENYECDNQMTLFDFTNHHTVQVLERLKADIEWKKDHATTNLAVFTYENCIEAIEKAIEEEK